MPRGAARTKRIESRVPRAAAGSASTLASGVGLHALNKASSATGNVNEWAGMKGLVGLMRTPETKGNRTVTIYKGAPKFSRRACRAVDLRGPREPAIPLG